MVIPITGHALVLWIHVLAACVWIGGQVVVAAMVPLARPVPELPAALGRRFQLVAWPAYGLLLLTGIANAASLGIGWGDLGASPAGRTLLVKLVLVAGSGLAAALHVFAPAPPVLPSTLWAAVLGSVSAGLAIGAALFGVVLAGG